MRDASPKLPSGRSLVGTIVDPLGLFQTSALVEVDDKDERILDAVKVLTKLLSDSPSASNVRRLSRDEAVQVAQILVPKLIENRGNVLLSSARFAQVFIRISLLVT